jgi:hypothetical protein
VGNLEPDYKESSIDNAIMAEIKTLNNEEKEKLLKTIKIWKK